MPPPDHVITASDFTRRTVIDRFDIGPPRVTTIWEALGNDVDWTGGAARVPEVRCRYGLSRPSAFYPANSWPHMARRILDLFERVRHMAPPRA